MRPWVQEWVDALRSGKHEQGTGRLCKDGKYCCLGVLCVLRGVDPGDMYALPIPLAQELGIGDVGNFTRDSKRSHLAYLNDSGLTFPQIADKIEEIERQELWVTP